jgi:hypothetical protein
MESTEPQVDNNLKQAILPDLYYLTSSLRKDKSDPTVQEVTRDYLLANEKLLMQALEEWRRIPESQRIEMEKRYSELDRSATSDGFWSIVMSPLNLAKSSVEYSSIGPIFDADNIHMLVRALEYSKYVTDTSSFKVSMHPVEPYLQGERNRQFSERPLESEIIADNRQFSERPLESKITTDYWTSDDRLGYRYYANAITEFIRHRDTHPPLTIGIKGPWGAGKTSLMRMIQERLDPPQDKSTWQPTTIELDDPSKNELELSTEPKTGNLGATARRIGRWITRPFGQTPVTLPITNWTVIQSTKETNPDLQAPKLEVEPPTDSRWRPTVWFNPWMYQTGEQVWAGLAHEIITQVSERMEPLQRERFWFDLNRRRVDPNAIRRKLYGVALERVVPALLFTIIALVALGLAAGLSWATTLQVGGLGGALLALIQYMRFLSGSASGVFPQLVSRPNFLDPIQKGLREEFAGSYEQVVSNPQYESRLGFLYLMQTDMRRVLELVATEKRPLVVFVDDLDRCSPSTVSQVIEAINLFLAGEFPNCIFILAVEPELVAAHVEVSHKDLVEKLSTSHLLEEPSTLGWRFLDKIVQLPLSLPSPRRNDWGEADWEDAYVKSLLGEGTGPETNSAVQASEPGRYAETTEAESASRIEEQDQARSQEAAESQNPKEPNAEEIVSSIRKSFLRQELLDIQEIHNAARRSQLRLYGVSSSRLIPEAAEAAERVFAEQFSDNDPEVREAIKEGARHLGDFNPRQIKRFINLFRFYTFIEAQRVLQDGTEQELVPTRKQIVKLAVLVIRWPHLLNAFTNPAPNGNTDSVLGLLEKSAYEAQSEHADRVVWNDALKQAGLLKDGSDSKPNFLKLQKFLASDPKIATVAARFI